MKMSKFDSDPTQQPGAKLSGNYSKYNNRIKFAVFMDSFAKIALKWLVAVLFTKVFGKLTAVSSEGLATEDSFFQTDNDLWKFIFLVDLSFEETLSLAVVASTVCVTSEVFGVYLIRIAAEKSYCERRRLVVRAATKGTIVIGGKTERTADEVTMILEVISRLQEYESVKKYYMMIDDYTTAIAFVFGLIITPYLSLAVISIFAAISIIGALAEKMFVTTKDKEFEIASKGALMRVLDIVRGADVVAVSDTAALEEASVIADGVILLKLQQTLTKLILMIKYFENNLIGLTLPVAMTIVYYGYESLGDDPTETAFSVLAFLIILEEIHKAMLRKSAHKEPMRLYKTNLARLNEWLGERYTLDDSDNENENDHVTIMDKQISVSIPDTGQGINSIETYNHVFDTSFAVESHDEYSLKEKLIPGNIVLKNVSISYGYKQKSSTRQNDFNHDKKVPKFIFQNENLVFLHNKRTALVGESGSGKSSILKVIAGLLLPYEGEISFGNLDITPRNRSLLRRSMGYCSQESLLFARTIRENVWYGNRDPVDDEKIIHCLEKVGLGEWISKQENGLDESLALGEGNVSGGQAQRLQLARLLCKDYVDLVLLDEACSALDTENRKNVLKTMENFLRNKTAVWITHHEDVLRAMDEVIDISKSS